MQATRGWNAERAALLMGLFGTAACVVPIGPEFRDPEPNYAPTLVQAIPHGGENVVAGTEISVQVSDPNLGDTLYVRWVFDYPPYSRSFTRLAPGSDETIPPPQDGKSIRILRPMLPSCLAHNPAPTLPIHQLVLLVADRPFRPLDTAPERYPYHAVSEGGLLLTVSWTIALDCSL